jgi:ArsR family transcriptional regulator, arsenate/arsenite/antimonite-responsive transcriptional repressor
MEILDVLASFAALSQDTRLATFRLLIKHEPCGLAAGEIARQLDVPHNTLSSHLNVLARADLVHARRDGRSIIYRANLAHLQQIIQFLAVDCCAGHPELCFDQEPLPNR